MGFTFPLWCPNYLCHLPFSGPALLSSDDVCFLNPEQYVHGCFAEKKLKKVWVEKIVQLSLPIFTVCLLAR